MEDANFYNDFYDVFDQSFCIFFVPSLRLKQENVEWKTQFIKSIYEQ